MPFTEELVRPPTPAAVSSSNTAAWSSSETSVLSAGSPVLQPMDFLDATEDHGTPLLEDLPDCPTPSQLDRVMFSSIDKLLVRMGRRGKGRWQRAPRDRMFIRSTFTKAQTQRCRFTDSISGYSPFYYTDCLSQPYSGGDVSSAGEPQQQQDWNGSASSEQGQTNQSSYFSTDFLYSPDASTGVSYDGSGQVTAGHEPFSGRSPIASYQIYGPTIPEPESLQHDFAASVSAALDQVMKGTLDSREEVEPISKPEFVSAPVEPMVVVEEDQQMDSPRPRRRRGRDSGVSFLDIDTESKLVNSQQTSPTSPVSPTSPSSTCNKENAHHRPAGHAATEMPGNSLPPKKRIALANAAGSAGNVPVPVAVVSAVALTDDKVGKE